jgi:gamma-glutamylcyclotransferase (GGCT)/AIG2-like uncharacterized protein YtfP
LPKLRRVEERSANGHLFAIRSPHLTYPALLLDRTSRAHVHGTCYEIGPNFNAADLALLDAYEEYFPHAPSKSEYLREAHPVALSSGAQIAAWIYVYNIPLPETVEPIPSGHFKEYVRRRR